MKLEDAYNAAMSIVSLHGKSNDQALELIAHLTDISSVLEKIEGARHAITLSAELQARDLTDVQAASLCYYLANAWADVKKLSRRGTDTAWDWEQDEIDKEIVYLRKALILDCSQELSDETTCRILTNLGNVFDHVGRFVEAIEYWDRALIKLPSFAMARGNKGMCLSLYAGVLYDPGHKILFLKCAHNEIEIALASPLEDGARTQFAEINKKIESMIPADYLQKDDYLNKYPIEATEQDIQYRQWCLVNRLFLNPLNDIEPCSMGAQDVLSTPSIVVTKGEGPYYQGFYNQIKQEFVSARYLYYEGINMKQPHFSDNGVLLIDTLDTPAYSFTVEKIKMAFRICYSLFDKTAYFLNSYLNLEIPERRVTFKTIWYESQDKDKGLTPYFQKMENWPLRGLYWLSKDLHECKDGFQDAIEPDARELSIIRNHLEHKYFKLHNACRPSIKSDKNRKAPELVDTLAYSVYREDFEAKTLRLMKIVRAALIYLSLGMHCNEKQRAKQSPDISVRQIRLATMKDDKKV